ncbi:hypothetical protein HK100_005546, partial [Physocladia obscura]
MGVKSLWALIKRMYPTLPTECNLPAGPIVAAASLVNRNIRPAADSRRKQTDQNLPVVNIFIDINAFLHRASAKAGPADDEKVIAAVLARIDRILFSKKALGTINNSNSNNNHLTASEWNRNNPRPVAVIGTVFLAIDGPPPMPKLILQRARREAVSTRRLTTTEGLKFSSINFTPGTAFMTKLDAVLSHYATAVVAKNPLIKECRVSGSRVPGEGEIKIVQRMAECYEERHALNSNNKLAPVDMVVTGDSDAIIQLLMSPSIFPAITTTTTESNQRQQQQHAANIIIYNPDQNVSLSLPNFEKALQAEFREAYPPLISPLSKQNQEAGPPPPPRAANQQPDQNQPLSMMKGSQQQQQLQQLQRGKLPIIALNAQQTGRIRNDMGLLIILTHGNDWLPKIARIGFEEVWDAYRNHIVDSANAGGQIRYLVDVMNGALDVGVLKIVLEKCGGGGGGGRWGFGGNNAVRVQVRQDSDGSVLDREKKLFEESVGAYIDMILWTVNCSTTGETQDFRIFYPSLKGPGVNSINGWIDRYMEMANGGSGNEECLVYWKGEKSRIKTREPLIPALCAVSVIPVDDRSVVDESLHPLVQGLSKLLDKAGCHEDDGVFSFAVDDDEGGNDAVVGNDDAVGGGKQTKFVEAILALEKEFDKNWSSSGSSSSGGLQIITDAKTEKFDGIPQHLLDFMANVRARHMNTASIEKYRKRANGSNAAARTSIAATRARFDSLQPISLGRRSKISSAGEGGGEEGEVVLEVFTENKGHGGGGGGGTWVWMGDVEKRYFGGDSGCDDGGDGG